MLTSDSYIREYKHSRLYVSLFSAHLSMCIHLSKRKRLQLLEQKKGCARNDHPDLDSYYQEFENWRILKKMKNPQKYYLSPTLYYKILLDQAKA